MLCTCANGVQCHILRFFNKKQKTSVSEMNRSESDPCSCEVTSAVTKKAQKKFWGSNGIRTHDLCNTAVVIFRVNWRVIVRWWYLILCLWSWFGLVSFVVTWLVIKRESCSDCDCCFSVIFVLPIVCLWVSFEVTYESFVRHRYSSYLKATIYCDT